MSDCEAPVIVADCDALLLALEAIQERLLCDGVDLEDDLQRDDDARVRP